MKKTRQFLAITVSAVCLMSLPALADDSAKLEALQNQLAQAMKLIEAQSAQMSQLQAEVQSIKSKETKKLSALEQDLQAVKAASVQPAAGKVSNKELDERIANAVSAASIAPAAGSSSADLEERLAEIEDVVYDLDEKVGSETIANAFDASNLDIGGFINTAYTYVDGESGSAGAFNRQNFELLIRADLSDDWSAFFAGGFLREGNVSFDDDRDGILNEAGERNNPDFAIASGVPGGTVTPEIIAWANYKHNDALNIQLGRQITPHGIINIEHFPATLLDQEQPLFLRPFGGQTIFPNFNTGVQAHGSFFQGDNTLSYNAYAGAAQSAIEETIYGGRLEYDFGKQGVTVGLNAAQGARSETVDSDYTLVGADLLIDKGPILWKNEIFATDEDDAPGRLGFYTQPAYRFNDKWIGFYRYDFLDDGANGTTAVPDNAGNVSEHMVGLNYLPVPNVRTRLTATRRDYGSSGPIGSADADIYQFSLTYSF